MTTRLDLKRWFNDGVKQKATHMIVAVDTFDHGDYPVYILSDDDVHKKINEVRMAPMQRIVEIYDLSMDREEQLNEHRVYNHPPFPTVEPEPAKK